MPGKIVNGIVDMMAMKQEANHQRWSHMPQKTTLRRQLIMEILLRQVSKENQIRHGRKKSNPPITALAVQLRRRSNKSSRMSWLLVVDRSRRT
jgi:hypothetical protein